MRALIATNHLAEIGGSEVIALEMAKALAARGFVVDVYANRFGELMANYFALADVGLIKDAERIRPFTYDFVYFQHQIAGLFDYGVTADDKESTRFVFGRLARRS